MFKRIGKELGCLTYEFTVECFATGAILQALHRPRLRNLRHPSCRN